jgi:hypothetical protein
MSAKCPKENSPEWKHAESKLDVDRGTLLYIFDFLGEREPSVKETNRLAKGETLTPSYNQAVWDVEKTEGLTQGRKGVVRKDKYGIEETVFEEVRTKYIQPTDAWERVSLLDHKYQDRFKFTAKPTKDQQAWNIFVSDLSVALRPDSNGKLQIDQSPKRPKATIEVLGANQYVRDGIIYPTMDDAINAPQDHRSMEPIAKGYTRMYRAELPILQEEGKLPDWVETQEEFKKTKEATGRWFYKTIPEAEEFGRDFGPAVGGPNLNISYVDVLTEDVEKYNAAIHPEAHSFQGGPGITNEYFLPKEIASKKIPVVQENNTFDRELFNRIKNRLLKVLPYVTNIVEDTSLPVSGRLMPGGTEIRINPNLVAKDTLGHEFGHVLIDILGGMSNPLIQSGREQLRNSPFESEVIALYPELVGLADDRLDKEILTRALGKKVTELFEEEEKRTKFENWMVRFYRKVRNALGIEISVVQQLAETMLQGKPLALESTASSRELKSQLYIQREIGMPYYQDSKTDRENTKIILELTKKEEELRKKSLIATEKKKGLYERKATGAQGDRAIESLGKLQKKLQSTTDATALIHFTRNAQKATKDISNLYAAAIDRERKGDDKAFNQRMLDEWRNYLSAYDILDQYLELLVAAKMNLSLVGTEEDKASSNKFLLQNKTLLSEATQEAKLPPLDTKGSYLDALIPVLQSLKSQKDFLKGLYTTKGKDLTIEFLMPYVTVIESDYREKAWKEYAKASEETKAGRSREQYIVDYVSDNREEITRLTRNLIAKEIEVGTDDLSIKYRYADTILDSPDVISSTLAKIWVSHMDENRKAVNDLRYQYADIIKALEKKYGRGITKSDEDFFSFLLERDPSKGNVLTQYLVSEVPSRLINDWIAFREQVDSPGFRTGSDNHLVTEKEERFNLKKEWLDKWAPLDVEARYQAEFNFLEGLHKDKLITMEQLNKWKDNEAETNWRHKKKDSDIFEESPDGLLELKIFRSKNFWEQRKLSKFYDDLNGQWKALEAMRAANPNDERIMFYDFIVKSMETADSLLPYKKRLGYKLPGMTRSFADRIRAGEPLKQAVQRETNIGVKKNVADTERGAVEEATGRSELTNEANETIYLIPTHFINQVDLSDQLFDVGTLYFNFQRMAMNYRATADILPQLEMGQYFLENREIVRRDAKGRPYTDALSAKRDRELTKSGKTSMIAAQFADFMKMQIFGMTKAEEPDLNLFGYEIDRAKFLDGINKYTSLSLLGLNIVAGTANVLYGEILQGIDAWGGEHFKTKNLVKATGRYYKDLPNVLADIGERRPNSWLGMLTDRFDVFSEYNGGKLNTNSKFRWLMQTSTMFFISHAGEHYMQSRAMMAMLDNIEAKDSSGKVLGTMLDMYTYNKETGRLEINKDVANWSPARETQFKNTLKRVLARMHGEYSQEGMSAIQRTALGRMALLFRKFMVPGFKRRWQKEQYNNLSDSKTEGNYITFGKFFGRLMKDMVTLKFELLSSNSELLPYQQANIKRTLGEITFLIAAIILSRFAVKMKDDDPDNERMWSFIAYQAFRLRSELAFYTMPTEAMKILRSPMASMSALESTIKLTGQLMDPLISGSFQWDVYERGPWKGEPKIFKTLTDVTPGFKQYFRVRDIADQLSWFQTASLKMN